MKISKTLCLCLPLALAGGYANAQEVSGLDTTFYLGAGTALTDDEFENDDTPFSVGIMHQSAQSPLIFGLDIAREGTMIDSTWGRDDEARQAFSINALIGANVVDRGRFKVDVAALVGGRESFSDCADSYLGYQCYADTPPETQYDINLGAVVMVSVERFAIGVRATGESAQILAGFRF